MLASSCSVALLHGSWCGRGSICLKQSVYCRFAEAGSCVTVATVIQSLRTFKYGVGEVWGGFGLRLYQRPFSFYHYMVEIFKYNFWPFFFLQISTCLTSKVAARTSVKLSETYLAYRQYHNREATLDDDPAVTLLRLPSTTILTSLWTQAHEYAASKSISCKAAPLNSGFKTEIGYNVGPLTFLNDLTPASKYEVA